MKHIPRFFTDTKLFAGFIADLSQEQRHHVFCVLRMEENEILNLFNPIDGEWECRIIDKKKGKVECEKQIRKCSENEDGAIVACAVIQPNNMSWMLEKITELGVSEIIPIITQYTNFRNFNEKKAQKIIIQACEQSKRLTVPKLHSVIKLDNFLNKYDYNYPLIVGDEKLPKNTVYECIGKKNVFLIGPEGGFSEEEHNLFDKYSFIKKVKISNNILRTETAAIAFVSISGCKPL